MYTDIEIYTGVDRVITPDYDLFDRQFYLKIGLALPYNIQSSLPCLMRKLSVRDFSRSRG